MPFKLYPSSEFNYTEFKVGERKLIHGRQTDCDGTPTKQWSVWLWNSHYWELLITEATEDFESAQHAARFHVLDGK